MAAVTQPRGPNPYAVPAGFKMPDLNGPNPFTGPMLARFFSTIPGDDVRAAVIQGVMSYPTLGQALAAMNLAMSGPWVGFDTSPPMPVIDHFINPSGGGPGGGGGGGPAATRKKLL